MRLTHRIVTLVAFATAGLVSWASAMAGPALASDAHSMASSLGPPGWYDTNSNAAQSRANLAEKVLTPSAVTSVKYLRSIVAPVIPPRAPCPAGIVAPLPAGGYVYAITNGTLSKYNPATGRLIWRSTPDPTFHQNYESLSLSANLVIVGANFCESASEPSATVYAFNASTGARVWSAAAAEGFGGADVVGTKYVVTAGADAAGSEVSVLNLSDGTPVWHSSYGCLTSGPPPVVVGQAVMGYGCDNQGRATLRALNLATGARMWSLPAGWTPQRGDLAGSAGQHLYAKNPAGTVVALNPLTGKVEYSLSHAGTTLAVDSSRVYATCGHKSPNFYICAYNSSTGAREWRHTQFPLQSRLAAEADGVLYLDSGYALNAATGHVITRIWGTFTYNSRPTAIAVGDGRIAVVGAPRVLDLFGLPGY